MLRISNYISIRNAYILGLILYAFNAISIKNECIS